MPQARKIIISDNDQSFLASCQNAFELLGMQVIPVPKHGRLLWDAIEKERPDLVVCNIFMAYCDAIHIMEHLSQSAVPVPVFVALCASDNECLFGRFLSAGGADVFVKPFDATILAERVFHRLECSDRKSNVRRVDFLCPTSSSTADAAELLKTIGVPAHLTGYHYIKIGLALLLENPARFSYGTKGLYQAIAQQAHSSYHRVERNIRTAVEAAFDRGDLELFEKFFGSSIRRKTGKPNNAQFIATLYEHLSSRKKASNG